MSEPTHTTFNLNPPGSGTFLSRCNYKNNGTRVANLLVNNIVIIFNKTINLNLITINAL